MVQKYVRTFLPADFVASDWESVAPFCQKLLDQPVDSLERLKQFLQDWSELEGVLEEEGGWRYIRTTCDTTDAAAKERYELFVTEIEPKLAPITDALNKKVMQAKEIAVLRREERFDIFCKKIENNLRCYREENIPLQTEVRLHANQYGVVAGAMTVDVQGVELTLQQAAAHLESTDRPFRKAVYDQIQGRRLRDKDVLNELYSKLIDHRHRIALQAGFANFIEYACASMHRFDYTPADCFAFHDAVREEVVPWLSELAAERKKKLGVPRLQPFDLAVDPEGMPPLRPFTDSKDLIAKTIRTLDRLDPSLAGCLRVMERVNHLDLDSRKGKAPGGYNYPLDETGIPFIFMNAASTTQDVVTTLHESGHAVHSFLVHELPLNCFKHCPSEVAELASMSMELLTMPHWDVFFPNPEELKRVQKDHLEEAIRLLAWVATIDAFQHWAYANPYHSVAERTENWNRIFSSFSDSVTDWTGYETAKDHLWQKQLHLFEVPFYYIEYGIAQLGALGVWKNSQEDVQRALDGYKKALKLGYTASISTVYATAGVRFDFSRAHVRSLVQCVREAWAQL